MARNKRVESEHDAFYHIVSRCNNKSFLFRSGRLKDRLSGLMERAAAFSGVKIVAYCLMDNHFHLVIKMIKPTEAVPEEEVMRRIGVLKGQDFLERLKKSYGKLDDKALETRLGTWRRRMHSLPEFVKTFKELVNNAYKAETEYFGSIFSGRYYSTMIEDGKYLSACIRYVEYNPIRAGIVKRAADYRWSSKNASVPTEYASQAGSVPAEGEAWLLRRMGQLSQGIVFGSREFVAGATLAFGCCFSAGSVPARMVEGTEAYATHGHLAGRKAA